MPTYLRNHKTHPKTRNYSYKSYHGNTIVHSFRAETLIIVSIFTSVTKEDSDCIYTLKKYCQLCVEETWRDTPVFYICFGYSDVESGKKIPVWYLHYYK